MELGRLIFQKFLRYLLSSTLGGISPGELKTIVEQSTMKDKGGLVMTLAEQLRNEGYQQGMIEMALSFKFGDAGLKMMEKIWDIRDIEKLKSIKELVQTADNLSDIETIIG